MNAYDPTARIKSLPDELLIRITSEVHDVVARAHASGASSYTIAALERMRDSYLDEVVRRAQKDEVKK